MPGLADFIQSAQPTIASEWEQFARSLVPGMSSLLLRDHIQEILDAIVGDMRTSQSPEAQVAKSRGRAAPGPLARVGQLHASMRLESGFRVEQLVAEYRALRATVLRLWEGQGGSDPTGVTRFNEAIDEALGEAVTAYVAKTDRYRDESLGILSHDLRSPLGAILMGATHLLNVKTLDDRSARVAASVKSSAMRMERMIRDLLDLTRTRLGGGIPVVRTPMDLDPLCRQVVAEVASVYPDRVLRYTKEGDLLGQWDADRMSQVLSNLVLNALEHGAKDEPVDLVARERADEILLEVHNGGPPIPPAQLGTMFELMVRHPRAEESRSAGLGLGLYIARHIVLAHGGDLGVTSTAADGTRFTVRLPRSHGGARREATR